GAWLKKSRKELAKLGEEWAETVATQEKSGRDHPQSVLWLPGLHAPVTLPVFRQAAFSTKAGFSLPPYLKPGRTDRALALHLARYGDHEAALKVADDATRRQIEEDKGATNYPLEWSRLVVLAQASAVLKLAGGDPEGASDLVAVHRQLRRLLDKKTAAGPLG